MKIIETHYKKKTQHHILIHDLATVQAYNWSDLASVSQHQKVKQRGPMFPKLSNRHSSIHSLQKNSIYVLDTRCILSTCHTRATKPAVKVHLLVNVILIRKSFSSKTCFSVLLHKLHSCQDLQWHRNAQSATFAVHLSSGQHHRGGSG